MNGHDRNGPAASELKLAGLTPFTTIDFPGRLSAVAFVQGCPWRCVYCQNSWMQQRSFDPGLEHSSWEELESLLKRRHGLLDGVVFSGGEPCLDPALPAAVRAVKEMGYEVGLHTGGSYPARLAEVLPDLSWVGLDVKAVPADGAHWAKVTGVESAQDKWTEPWAASRFGRSLRVPHDGASRLLQRGAASGDGRLSSGAQREGLCAPDLPQAAGTHRKVRRRGSRMALRTRA